MLWGSFCVKDFGRYVILFELSCLVFYMFFYYYMYCIEIVGLCLEVNDYSCWFVWGLS